MSKILKGGGYPDSATVTIASVIDEDIMPALKTNEGRDTGIYADKPFTLKQLAIIADADTWVVLNDGSEIPVIADIPYSIDSALVFKLAFKTVVNYKIAYAY